VHKQTVSLQTHARRVHLIAASLVDAFEESLCVSLVTQQVPIQILDHGAAQVAFHAFAVTEALVIAQIRCDLARVRAARHVASESPLTSVELFVHIQRLH